MERADVQQEAALETAAPPTVERQREQQRIQAPSYISPRDPRLQMTSQADAQPSTTPAQPLQPGSAADGDDSRSLVSVESEQGLAASSDRQASPTQAGGSEEQQRAEERSQRQCSHCGCPDPAGKSYRHAITRALLCSACGMYARYQSGRLPSADLLQRREQQRKAVPPNQRQCLQCGSSTPGAGCNWYRHRATKEEWICHKCYERARIQLQRKRQREAAATAPSSDGDEEAWEEGEEAHPPSPSPPAPQQQAAPVQSPMPGPPVQQQAPANLIADHFAEAGHQQQLQGPSERQQPQGESSEAAWESVPEQLRLLPANMPPPQASTGLLVLEAAQQAAAAAAGLTELLAGTFAALLPMPAEQDECLRLMVQRRQYSGAAGLMRAVLHRGLDFEGAAEASSSLLGAFEPPRTRICHLPRPSIERLVRAVADMERADVQQEAVLETAAPPTAERQQEQQRMRAPAYISPRDPRLQLTIQADPQPHPLPAELLHPGSAADGEDSGSPESVEREDGPPLGSLAQVAGSEGQQEAKQQSQRQCSHCGSPDPVGQWLRHPTTRALLCDACGCYARRNNGKLPSAALLQRRMQQRQVVAASKLRHVAPNQRQCMQCGARTSRSSRGNWHRHPVTEEEWMCHVCYNVALNQLKRKRQREAAVAATSSDGEEEAWEEGEEAHPPSPSPPAPQQQAAPERPTLPGPPVQQRVPATLISDRFAEAGHQEQLQGPSERQQPQGESSEAARESVPELPALLPANTPPPQASTGLLVLKAAQQAAGAAAGLTEELAGTFAALLPMPTEQDECLRVMLQRRQYSSVVGLMRAQRAALALLLCALLGGASAAELGDRMAATVDGIKQVHEAKVSGARAVHEAMVSGARAVHEQKVSLLRSQLSAKAAKLSGSAATTASTSASASTTVTAMSTPTAIPANCLSVAEVAQKAGTFTTLLAAAQASLAAAGLCAAGLSSALSDRSLKATVFAPSDEAFEAALADLGMTSAQLLVDTEMLQAILKYHVVPGDALTSADLRDEQKLPTLLAADLEGAAEGDEDGVLTIQVQQVYSLAGRSSRVKVDGSLSSAVVVMPDVNAGCPAVVHVIDNVLLPDVADDCQRGLGCEGAVEAGFALNGAFEPPHTRSCHLPRPSIERLMRAVADMERAGVQQEAVLETAAPPTVERQQEQQRMRAPAYISPRDPRLQLPGLVGGSQFNAQPQTLPAPPLHPDSVAAGADSGSPPSAKSEQGQDESSDRQASSTQADGSEDQKRAEERSQQQCSHCGCPDPAGRWDKHPRTRAWLCSACGQYARQQNGRLPSAVVLERREQQRQAIMPHQRQCLQCGANTPGAGQHWRRHPATKEEWMCGPCYTAAQQQLKRKRQPKAAEESSSGSGSADEESEENCETPALRQPPPSPKQQAVLVQLSLPGPSIQQGVPANVVTGLFAGAKQQQRQGMTPDAAGDTAPERPSLLPANMPLPQASTGLLVMEAAQQAAGAAAGLTEGLAGTFAALLPLPAEQDECLRLMLQQRQYSGAAGLMRAVLHVRGIPPLGQPQAPLEQLQRRLGSEGAAEAGFSSWAPLHQAIRSCHLLSPVIERLVRAVAGMERAGVQQEAALETAPTVERQQEQHRIEAPAYISPRDPRLQLPGLASGSQTNTQPLTTPAQPLHLASAAAAAASGSPESVEREDGPPLGRSSSLTQVAGSEGQQEAEERSQRQCSHCGCPDPVGQWHRHPTTRAWLCHACGGYARRNEGSLPSVALLQLRVQQRLAVPPNQRQCLQCGASTCRSSHGNWHRHPVTKEEWMCYMCYQRAYYQLKSKRQREAAAAATSSDGEEESWEEGEQAQPPSPSPPATQQQAASLQPPMPGPSIQQQAPANLIADHFAQAGPQQQLQALSQWQQPQEVTPDARWGNAPEKPALLPANMTPPQASTGLLVLEAAQQAAGAAAGLTEGLAGTFAALLPMPAEQDECLRLMLQHHQFSGAAGLMRTALQRGLGCVGAAEAGSSLLGAFEPPRTRICHLPRPSIERLMRAVADMERAGVQQEAVLETAAAPTTERQREQQRNQAPSYISPRDPRLQMSSLAETQIDSTPAQLLHPASVAAAVDSGSPVSQDRGQPAGSDLQLSPAPADVSKGQQGAGDWRQRQCSHCGSPIPGRRWYRHPTTRALLCNGCGKYARSHSGSLPAEAVLQRRERQRNAVPPNQRQCLQCGASTPGAGCNWTRHPATKEEWLCKCCYQRANYQLKRKRKRQAAEDESSSSSACDAKEEVIDEKEAPPHRKAATVAHHQAAPAQPAMPGPPSWHNRPAAAAAPSTDSEEEEEEEEGEEAQPPSQSAPSPKQQAALVQAPLPGPPGQHCVPEAESADGFAAAADKQQHLQALSQQQQQQGVTPDATLESVPEQPGLLPANMPPPQASTGLLVLEAVQQAAAAAAGLTELLAGTFAAMLPMPAEQDECLRLMLQRRQYSGAAGLMRALLHERGIPPPALPEVPPEWQ
ncbi:hypothetical protein ACK3TF_004502 [Chlorella vulgaris]